MRNNNKLHLLKYLSYSYISNLILIFKNVKDQFTNEEKKNFFFLN